MAITAGIINRCLEECYKSTYHFRIGAVIFNSKRIISSGHNGLRTSSNIPDKHKNFINSLLKMHLISQLLRLPAHPQYEL